MHWTTALLARLVMTAWDMWQHCNKALHESKVNQQEILKDAITQQINQVYTQGRDQLPRDARQLMKWSLPQLLQLPATYKQQWMATVVVIWKQVQGLTGVQNLCEDVAMPNDFKPLWDGSQLLSSMCYYYYYYYLGQWWASCMLWGGLQSGEWM